MLSRGTSTSTAPEVAGVSPEAMRSSVDFPQPDGPTTATNSPGATDSVTLAIASVPSGNVLPMLWKRSAVSDPTSDATTMQRSYFRMPGGGIGQPSPSAAL